jgi:hypothetical protein
MAPGVGSILCATVEFPQGRMDEQFDVTAAGTPGRRKS